MTKTAKLFLLASLPVKKKYTIQVCIKGFDGAILVSLTDYLYYILSPKTEFENHCSGLWDAVKFRNEINVNCTKMSLQLWGPKLINHNLPLYLPAQKGTDSNTCTYVDLRFKGPPRKFQKQNEDFLRML